MARTKGIGGIQFSGKLGDLVFVPYGNEMIIRRAPEQRKREDWSEKQRLHRARFSGVNAFYRLMKETFVEPIWKLSATRKLTGYNLFMKANMPAFNELGQIADYSLLHFSCGPLPLPQNLKATRRKGHPELVEINWNPKGYSMIEAPDDELCYVLLMNPKEAKLQSTGIHRSCGQYLLELSNKQTASQSALFLFFRNRTADCYSSDKFFSL